MPLSDKDIAELLRGLPADADDATLKTAAKQAEAGTPLQKIWAWVNRPVAGSEDALIPALAHKHGDDESSVRRVAEDLGASLTSPISLATAASGIGAGIAGARGALGISKAARAAEATLQVPFVAEGAHKLIAGDTVGEKLAGGVEAALGAHGVRSAATHAFDPKAVVSTYVKERGIAPTPREPFDPAVAKQTADAYEAMPHTPNDPKVAASYDALKSQIDDQHKFLAERAGVKIEQWTQPGEPYPKGSAQMREDVVKNNHLWYLGTDAGTNANQLPLDHPMAEDTAEGLANDKFRAVHDYFGHAAEGNSFGQKGEQEAYNAHRQTLTPEAHGALTTETKGQNSWVNSGAHLRNAAGDIPTKGQPGFVPPSERPFAPQKAGLLPEPKASFDDLDALEHGQRIGNTPFSTQQSAASRPSGTAGASSLELSPELPQIVNQLHTQNGGATYNLASKRSLVGEPFYAISAFPDRGLVLDHAPTDADFANYIHKNLDLLEKPEHSIGTWFNPDDKKHYLDISITEPDRAKALALGKQHNQLAIFDLKNLDTINVPNEGTIAPKSGHAEAELENIRRNAPFGEGSIIPSAVRPSELANTAMAVAAPSAAMQIDDSDPNDSNHALKSYGKVALNLLGAAGLGAAIRKNVQAPQKAAAAKGAAFMLLDQNPKSWMKRMLGEGIPHEELPKIRAASEKMLSAQMAKAAEAMPNTKKLMAHFESGKAEMGWYDEVKGELSELFGKDADLMADLLAATSSNATVKSNVALALKAYEYHKTGVSFDNLPKGKGFLPAVVMNIKRVIAGEPIAGRKIDNFAKALKGDPDAVVVDRWMMRAFGFTAEKDVAPTAHEYDVIEHAVKDLAKKQGVTPRQMQASIWFSIKNKTETAAGRVNEAPPYGKLIRDKQAQQQLPLAR